MNVCRLQRTAVWSAACKIVLGLQVSMVFMFLSQKAVFGAELQVHNTPWTHTYGSCRDTGFVTFKPLHLQPYTGRTRKYWNSSTAMLDFFFDMVCFFCLRGTRFCVQQYHTHQLPGLYPREESPQNTKCTARPQNLHSLGGDASNSSLQRCGAGHCCMGGWSLFFGRQASPQQLLSIVSRVNHFSYIDLANVLAVKPTYMCECVCGFVLHG